MMTILAAADKGGWYALTIICILALVWLFYMPVKDDDDKDVY